MAEVSASNVFLCVCMNCIAPVVQLEYLMMLYLLIGTANVHKKAVTHVSRVVLRLGTLIPLFCIGWTAWNV